MATKASKQIMHERSEKGQHRLLIIIGGMHHKSEWYPNHTVGLFKGYYFAALPVDSIPAGVFRVSGVEHQEL